jgi:hypothetical protein
LFQLVHSVSRRVSYFNECIFSVFTAQVGLVGLLGLTMHYMCSIMYTEEQKQSSASSHPSGISSPLFSQHSTDQKQRSTSASSPLRWGSTNNPVPLSLQAASSPGSSTSSGSDSGSGASPNSSPDVDHWSEMESKRLLPSSVDQHQTCSKRKKRGKV